MYCDFLLFDSGLAVGGVVGYYFEFIVGLGAFVASCWVDWCCELGVLTYFSDL